MINNIRNHYTKLIPIIGIGFLLACSKEKTPVPVVPEPTKWEKIAGHYKVYDTTGVYLYEMDLIHKTGFNLAGFEEDSLVFENFDGEFTFTSMQYTPPPVNLPMCVRIGGGILYMIPIINDGNCIAVCLMIIITSAMILSFCVSKKQTSIIILRI